MGIDANAVVEEGVEVALGGIFLAMVLVFNDAEAVIAIKAAALLTELTCEPTKLGCKVEEMTCELVELIVELGRLVVPVFGNS